MLEAPPGAGKTTRIPPAIAEAFDGRVIVSEPRRLAARLAAVRVADEQGQKLGGAIGYTVRFDDKTSAATRLSYVTDGILVRRVLSDPELVGVGVVVLDEFHERHLASDLVLALLRRAQRRSRPDLKIVVMSATLETEPVARFLDDAPRLRSEGRTFDLEIEHLPQPDDRPLEKQVVSAVKTLVRRDAEGSVLVFLPGAGEIRKAREALGGLADGIEVLPLHGDLTIAEQARAVGRGEKPKVILSTNVAESSVTVHGVTGVVDSGLARVASHSPWSGIPKLELGKISRASATQRSGRAGRTAPGRALRLYTRGDFEGRREHDAPEIERLDLTEALLTLHGANVDGIADLDWLDEPPAPSARAAEELLEELGALLRGEITELGRRLLRFPVHPRLARLIVEGERLGVAREACTVCALLGERDLRLAARTAFGDRRALDVRGSSDLVELLDAFDSAEALNFDQRRLRFEGIDHRAARAVKRARDQLVRNASGEVEPPENAERVEEALALAVLSAFPDRVARRRRPGSRDLVMCQGSVAHLSETSVVHDAPLLVAADAEQRTTGKRSGTVVRLAQAIEPEWLLGLPGSRLGESDELSWSGERERVERVTRMTYGSVVLDEQRARAEPCPEAARLLVKAALAMGPRNFGATDVESLAARIALVRSTFPAAQFPELSTEPARDALEAAASASTGFDELRAVDLAEALAATLSPGQRRSLDAWAPVDLRLPGGRSAAIVYERDMSPRIESRLQDFFGMSDTPSICEGRVPLTLHLLAPNKRAVQVTADLAGFWERHYPALRKQLMRRYPKHSWPENGRTAKPPPPGRLR